MGLNTLQEIQNEIQDKKRKRRKAAITNIVRWVFILVMGVGLAFAIFLYDKSDYSRVNTVYVTGNYYVSDQEVIDQLGFELGTSFYGFRSSNLENKVPEDSFIESINVTKHWFNQSMTIDVVEKKVVGYRITPERIELVAIDGSIQALLDKSQFPFLQDLPRFSGFLDDEALAILVDGISRADTVLYSNISEIIREPKTYDENYIRVMLADGVQLHTSIYSLESLDAHTFTEIFNRLNEDQKCIVYDVFWRSTYAKPCEQAQTELETEETQEP